jgi:hypothetical protein
LEALPNREPKNGAVSKEDSVRLDFVAGWRAIMGITQSR